ncbi:MAG: Sec-independent protein translocase protein TatB [Azoarcus sp.]|jgi:sec-independent protein translocase protein TatB|nr:Sec-independent protein translocase protein TatB [Azoarcus sp.]
MFDLGFSEIVVIAIVLLVVVGPERLPGVARTAGHLLGRFHRYVAEVKADIRREIQVDELKKLREHAQTLDQTLRAEVGEIQADMREALTFTETAPAPDDAGHLPPGSQREAALETPSPPAAPVDKT